MGKKMSEILYERYEYLAQKYASKIFSYEELSLEYEDLLQEFRMKIYTSIKAYGRRWLEYKRTGCNKPMPIKYYLEAACSNKSRDFIKLISRENYKTSIDAISFDVGIENCTYIDSSANKFVLNDVDLLEGLSGKERMVFSLYLRGYKTKILNKVYKNKKVEMDDDIAFTATDIIEMQKSVLIKKYGSELRKACSVYQTFTLDD